MGIDDYIPLEANINIDCEELKEDCRALIGDDNQGNIRDKGQSSTTEGVQPPTRTIDEMKDEINSLSEYRYGIHKKNKDILQYMSDIHLMQYHEKVEQQWMHCKQKHADS